MTLKLKPFVPSLRRRFTGHQEDTIYALGALLPSIAETLATGAPVESLVATLQESRGSAGDTTDAAAAKRRLWDDLKVTSAFYSSTHTTMAVYIRDKQRAHVGEQVSRASLDPCIFLLPSHSLHISNLVFLDDCHISTL